METKVYKNLYLAVKYKHAIYNVMKYGYAFSIPLWSTVNVHAKYKPKANYLTVAVIYHFG